MGARGAFCLTLAILLTAGAVLMMFPNWLFAVFPQFSVPGDIVDFNELDIYHFPFYGNAQRAGETAAYGVSDFVKSYADYVTTGAPAPNAWAELGKITSQEGFLSTLYAFTLISLLTIPVYMLMRLLVYDAVYAQAERAPFLIRVLLRGAVAASASLVTVFLTWFLYRTLVFELALTFLLDKLEAITSWQFALNATNIVVIVVIAVAVVALLRATLFRGSIITSVLGAFLRTVLYVLLIAIISIFIGETTLRTLAFMLAGLFVIGGVKSIFLPEKRAAARAAR